MEHGYHGDTIGAMSVGARGAFTEPYEPLLFDVERIPFPAAGARSATLEALERTVPHGHAAALIVEPLVLGAGGMLMYPPAVLAELRRICAAHGVLFIADEVMTGWGRTGTMFACEQAGISPDIACYSKGLTGGALPLAVTLCRHEIFEAHYSTDRRRTFFHSSSFTANPIACAAALANLEIWETEPVRERIAALAALQAEHLERFRDDARFENVRQTGTITAMDLKAGDRRLSGGGRGRGCAASFGIGEVLLRPLGNTHLRAAALLRHRGGSRPGIRRDRDGGRRTRLRPSARTTALGGAAQPPRGQRRVCHSAGFACHTASVSGEPWARTPLSVEDLLGGGDDRRAREHQRLAASSGRTRRSRTDP